MDVGRNIPVTEVEAYEVFAAIAGQQYELMFGYFSVVTAFLIMSYFVADKIDNFLATIAAVLCANIVIFGSEMLSFLIVNLDGSLEY